MEQTVALAPASFADLYIIPWLIRIATAAAIWFIGKWVADRLTDIAKRVMARAQMDLMLVQFIGNIVNTVLLAIVVIAVLDRLGIHTTSMLAVFGAAGLAVGLALKDSLGNFASGVMLILFRPFKVGDQIDGGGVSGIVEEIRIFSTLMRTPDNRQIVVPNGGIANGVIVNYNAKPTRRVDLTFSIGYDDDIRQAKAIIDRILRDEPLVMKDPAPAVQVTELAESSVNLGVNAWAATSNYGTVRANLLENIKLAFDDAGISIPYPQRELHLHTVPAVDEVSTASVLPSPPDAGKATPTANN